MTHGLAAAASKGLLSSQSLEASSRVAQLEAEIAQLKEALRQRQQIGVATGLLAHASRSFLSGPGRPLEDNRRRKQWRC